MPDPRAEAAYQRALAAYRVGAREAARRFSDDALAADPKHEGARALVASLEANRAHTPSAASVPPSSQPQAPRIDADRTIVSSPSPPINVDRTIVRPPPKVSSDRPIVSSPPPRVSDRTIVNPPPPRVSQDRTIVSPQRFPIGADARGAGTPGVSSPPAPRLQPAAGREAQRSPVREPFWTRNGLLSSRYRGAALIAGVVVVAAGVAAASVYFLLSTPGPALTIRKPTGGTISGRGISCGTLGSDCSVSGKTGDTIELDVQADKGFVFGGYTGDCAPTGRTILTGPRTCGATFVPEPTAGPVAQGHQLTISQPKGGTILSVGIQCGTLASECATTIPDGAQVTLHNLPDGGFTFVRYTGGCAPSGETLMKGPLTCGAEFAAVSGSGSEAQAAPLPPPPSNRRAAGRSAGALPTPEFSLPPPTPGVPSGESSPAGPSPNVGVQGLQGPLGVTTREPPPPEPADVTAKRLIQITLEKYCVAQEALDPEGVLKVYRRAELGTLRNQFRQFKSVKCMLMGPPEYVRLDPAAGTANVKVPMKQIFDQKVGGVAPLETIMVTALVRPEARGDWVIDTLRHEPKPK